MVRSQGLEEGLWGILATPFHTPALDVDKNSLFELTSHFEKIGATGVVALGVFGEGASLGANEQVEVIKTVTSATSLPVIVGISERTTVPAIEQALRAKDVAADSLRAVMVQVNSPQSKGLITHLQRIYEATNVPVLLQDYPVVSGVKISVASTLEVLEACPFIIGLKSESPPTAQVIAELRAKIDIPLIGGLGGVGLIDELAAGAVGAMTGFSYPVALLDAIRAFRDGGFEAAREVFAPWLPLANFEAQPGIALAIRKRIYQERGIFREASVRPPAPSFPPSLEPLLKDHLRIAERLLHSRTAAGSK